MPMQGIRHGAIEDGAAGFTLVEVVVALVIIGMVVAVVFETLASSRRLSIKADDTLEAARVLRNVINDRFVIDDLLVKEKDKDEVQVSSDVPGEPGWGYAIRMTPLQLISDDERDPLDVASVMNLRICVFHQVDSREKRYCVDRWFRNDDVLAQVGGLRGGSGPGGSRRRSR